MIQELALHPQISLLDRVKRGLLMFCASAMLLASAGCGAKGFFDPSKTGYFHRTPITMPILDRIDAIEPGTRPWGDTSSVTPEDLLPNDLTYRLHPGDMIEIQVFELYETERFHPLQRRIDQGGYVSIPEAGAVPIAGLTIEQAQAEIVHVLREHIMASPTVTLSLMEGAAFNYIIYGHVPNPGRFNLSDPQLRLLEALTMAGGVPVNTRRVYVTRQVTTVDAHTFRTSDRPTATRPESSLPASDAPDLEALIRELDNGSTSAPARPSPGAFPAQAAPPVDIEDLRPIEAAAPSVNPIGNATTSYIFIPEKDAWVEVTPQRIGRQLEAVAEKPAPVVNHPAPKAEAGHQTETLIAHAAADRDLILERIIAVDYQRLARGENDLNLVVRPGDQINVDGPAQGLYYMEGEINRPGVFEMPSYSERITLSRAVAGAGGLGALAVPNRVDLVRMVGDGREATIRLDLSAIRSRTEPDVYLKPGDHIIVGTDFWAYPLAVFRNGLRINYGFGFLLDRNFGNDVFGAPPVNYR